MTEVPKGWLVKPLGEVADTQLGKMLNRSNQVGDSTIPYLRNINVQWGRVDLEDVKQMDIYPHEVEKFTAQPGDLLVCEGGESGRAAIWTGLAPIGIQNALHRVRPKGELLTRYLFYYFEWQAKSKLLDHLFSGVTITHFPQEKLRKMLVQYPPIEQQHRIVEALDDHLSRLDKALFEVELGRIKEKLFKRSLLHSIFENLDSDVFELGNVSKPKYGKDVPKHLRGDGFAYPVVGSAGVMTYTEVALVEAPSVLVGRKGNVGAVQMFATPCSPVDTAYYLICPEDVDLEFMYFQLQSIDLKSLDSSTTIPSLRRQDLEAVHFRKPDLATQRAISQEIKIKLSSIDAALDQLRTISATLSVLRRSLLNAAFTGTLLKDVQ